MNTHTVWIVYRALADQMVLPRLRYKGVDEVGKWEITSFGRHAETEWGWRDREVKNKKPNKKVRNNQIAWTFGDFLEKLGFYSLRDGKLGES